MKKNRLNSKVTLSILALACAVCTQAQTGLPKYVPESKELHDTIARMDSIFFDAYDNCKLQVFEEMISENVEFYHDQGGLSTSKKDLIASLKKNICGKVTRELLKGSIEVYPIPNYGAVEMGVHRFHNNQEPADAPFHYSKFVQIWKKENGQWKLARVISLH